MEHLCIYIIIHVKNKKKRRKKHNMYNGMPKRKKKNLLNLIELTFYICDTRCYLPFSEPNKEIACKDEFHIV